jgi:hypothetical protein
MNQLADRWSQLASVVAQEFWRARQDPSAALREDFSTRTLRAHLSPNEQDGETFVVTVAENELINGDLNRLAHDFVGKYRQAIGA